MQYYDDLPPDWAHPEWDAEDEVHNWRNYVGESTQNMWESFTYEQRMTIANDFNVIASGEH